MSAIDVVLMIAPTIRRFRLPWRYGQLKLGFDAISLALKTVSPPAWIDALREARLQTQRTLS
jgi:hypothetical protein